MGFPRLVLMSYQYRHLHNLLALAHFLIAWRVLSVLERYFLFQFIGVSYFVYNEDIDIYSGLDPAQQEFMDAGLDYLESIPTIVTTLPIYRLYRNKTYRNYEKILRRMQRAGTLSSK